MHQVHSGRQLHTVCIGRAHINRMHGCLSTCRHEIADSCKSCASNGRAYLKWQAHPRSGGGRRDCDFPLVAIAIGGGFLGPLLDPLIVRSGHKWNTRLIQVHHKVCRNVILVAQVGHLHLNNIRKAKRSSDVSARGALWQTSWQAQSQHSSTTGETSMWACMLGRA